MASRTNEGLEGLGFRAALTIIVALNTILSMKNSMWWLVVLLVALPVNCATHRSNSEGATKSDWDVNLEHEGKTRLYRVHTPPTYRSDGTKFPVLIYIHGGGGGPKSAYIDGLDRYSDKLNFVLIIPRGSSTKEIGLGAAWNGGVWKGGKCCGDSDDIGFISKVIDDVTSKLNVDKMRIYVTGISNGGLMTNRIGCELSNKVAAIATVAPAALLSSCKPVRPLPVLNIHGTGDLCNPYDGSYPKGVCARVDYKRMSPREIVEKWVELNSCDKKPIEEKANAITKNIFSCKNGVSVEFWRAENMGHTWPDGSQYLPKAIVGPVSREISTESIWDFLTKHTLN